MYQWVLLDDETYAQDGAEIHHRVSMNAVSRRNQ
jgi:hypothetical protein